MVARSSSARWGEVQKILVREVHRVFRCPKYIKNMLFLCFKIILSNQREVQSDNNRKFTYYMVCISYKKNTIKWNRVNFEQTCPRNSTTSRSAKNSTSKIRVKFKQTCPGSSTTSRNAFPFTMKAEIMILSFSNLLQNDRNIICVSSSPRSEKVKKIIVREVCTKRISFV